MANTWQTYIGISNTLEKIADVSNNCTSKSLQLSLNKPGTYTFNIPMFNEFTNYLNPAEYCIILSKNKTDVWSGPIWTKSEDFVSEKIAISAVGWFQLLNKRFITSAVSPANKTFSSVNQGAIAFALLDIANAQEIDSIAKPTGITTGTNTSTGTRTRTYDFWMNIGQEITNLTEIESGFDFTIDPATREMNIKNWDEYRDNTSAKFGLNFGIDNISALTRDTEVDDLQNQIFVTGGSGGTAEVHDLTGSIDQYGLHQQTINISETSDISIIAAIANAELAVNSRPRIVINFDPKGTGPENVPSLFEDYDLGDKVYLTAKRDGAEIINQGARIFGITVNVDDNGVEKVASIQTQASG